MIVAKTYLIWAVPVMMTTRLLSLSPLTYLRQFAAPLFAAGVMAGVIFSCGRVLSSLPAPVELGCKILLGAITYGAILLLTERTRMRKLVSLMPGLKKEQGSALHTAQGSALRILSEEFSG